MAIGDLFRPKYKHSDPEVRAEAVRTMSAEDLELLLEVARGDRDPGIRRQAIEKIGDADALATVADDQEDARLRELARVRAVELRVAEALAADTEREALARVAQIHDQKGLAEIAAGARLKVVRSAALDRLDDDRALAQVVRQASGADEWSAALERIGDIEVLRAIAMDEQRKDVAFAAVDRIEDAEILEVVAARAKSKAARGRAKRRKAQIESAEEMSMSAPVDSESAAQKRAHAERVQIVRLVEKRAMGGEWAQSRREVDEAVRRWEELGAGDDTELAARFAAACKRYDDNHARYARPELPATEAAPAAELPATAAAAEAPATPEAAAAEVAPAPVVEAVGAPEPVSGAVTVPYSYTAITEPVASAAPTGEAEAPAAPPAREASPEEREKNAKALEELCARVEKLVEQGKLKGFEKSLKKADRQRQELGPLPAGSAELEARYQAAHAKAVIRLGELREAEDWKRWANLATLEKLIGEAEALESRADDEDRLGKKLKDLQERWKKAGPAPREKSQELWDRFKAVCDRIYERVKAQRAALSEVQKENLRRKEELCARAEALSESTDWDATAEAFKQLQAEWKKVGPVPRRKADAVWKRFRAACDLFFERRRPHLEEKLAERSGNLEAKERLIAEVEALAADESLDPEEAIHRVKRLQRQWRDIGPVPQKQFHALQKRYKRACDAVYGLREAARERARAEAAARAAEVAETVAAAEALVADAAADAAEVARAVLGARSAVLESGGAVRHQLGERMEALCARAIEAQPGAFAGTELDPEQSRKRKEKLIARVEELAPAPQASDANDMSAEAIAERLRAALADRALGGVLSKTGGRAASEVVAEARQSWSRLGPVPGEQGAELERRFRAACERALAG